MSDEPTQPSDEKPLTGMDTAKEKTADADAKMYVKVYAPYKVYYEGDALSVSAESQTGPFDILPRHHNFITLLTACEIIVRTPTHEEKIRIQSGIMHVKADSIIVFLDV